MWVRLLVERHQFANGATVDLADHEAISLIQAGFAVPADEPTERAVKKPTEKRVK